MPAIDLGGLTVSALRRAQLEDLVLRELERNEGGWIVTANLDIHRQCTRCKEAADLVEAVDLVVGDGMPLVWASQLAGVPLPERVAGSDLIWTLSRRAGEHGRSIYLLGGRPGAAQQAAERIQRRSPGLRVAGCDCPPHGFDAEERAVAAVLERVRAANPDIVYVGLGFSKQDRMIQKLREVAPRSWCIGVGAGIDFAAGNVRRAPRLAQRLGCEWLFRFAQEPRRLGRRYLLDGSSHAVRLFAWALRQRLAARHGHGVSID